MLRRALELNPSLPMTLDQLATLYNLTGRSAQAAAEAALAVGNQQLQREQDDEDEREEEGQHGPDGGGGRLDADARLNAITHGLLRVGIAARRR